MKRKPGRADRRDRDYLGDWNDWHAFERWKEGPVPIQTIHDVKSRGLVAALPMLIPKSKEDSEDGGEALEAVFVIIKKNPGDRRILSMVPSLVSDLHFDEKMFDASNLLSAIAEANPDSPETLRFVPDILGRLGELTSMAGTLDVKFTLESLAQTLGYLGDKRALPALRSLLASDHCNVGSEFERHVQAAIGNIHR